MISARIDKSKAFPNSKLSVWLFCKPYDPLFISNVKTLPLRAYDSTSKGWEIPLFQIDVVKGLFPDLYIEGDIKQELPKEFNSVAEYEAYLNALTLEVPFETKTRMKPTQVEWFNKMLTRDKVLNADPMGFGKTKEYLDVCEYRKQTRGYRKVLFISGAKYVYNMRKQVLTHTSSTATVVSGVKKKRVDLLRDFYYNDDYYLIIGYEAAGLHTEELRLLADNMGFDAVIIDEVQKIKNYPAKYRKPGDPVKLHITEKIVSLVEYINPELVILGTGTPVSKKAEDLYSILRLTQVENRNIWKFRDYFCQFDNFRQICGYKHLGELHDELDQVMIRRPKELLHLQKPEPEYVALRMDAEQQKFYQAVLLQLRSELKGTKAISASSLSKILRLRQATTNPALLDSEAPSIKQEVLFEMVANAVENGEKSIVYSMYVDEVNIIFDKFEKAGYHPAKVIGAMSAKKSQAEVDRFQDSDDCMVMVGSLKACKESYDMYHASNVFLVDLSYNWTDNDQAIARAWRLGLEHPINIYYLYCEGTIDEAVFDILINDKRLADQLVGIEGETVRTFDPDVIERLLRSPKDIA